MHIMFDQWMVIQPHCETLETVCILLKITHVSMFCLSDPSMSKRQYVIVLLALCLSATIAIVVMAIYLKKKRENNISRCTGGHSSKGMTNYSYFCIDFVE